MTWFLLTLMLCAQLVFIHEWRNPQFTADFAQQIFGKTSHRNFIYLQSFCQKSAENKSPKIYFFQLERSDLGFEPQPQVNTLSTRLQQLDALLLRKILLETISRSNPLHSMSSTPAHTITTTKHSNVQYPVCVSTSQASNNLQFDMLVAAVQLLCCWFYLF